jgi:hypothetical protein
MPHSWQAFSAPSSQMLASNPKGDRNCSGCRSRGRRVTWGAVGRGFVATSRPMASTAGAGLRCFTAQAGLLSMQANANPCAAAGLERRRKSECNWAEAGTCSMTFRKGRRGCTREPTPGFAILTISLHYAAAADAVGAGVASRRPGGRLIDQGKRSETLRPPQPVAGAIGRPTYCGIGFRENPPMAALRTAATASGCLVPELATLGGGPGATFEHHRWQVDTHKLLIRKHT